jgi:hypothetical protein
MSVDFAYIESIFGRLSDMDVQLDPNPVEYGPGRLAKKVAEVRAFLSNTEKIFLEVSHNLAKYKRDLLVSETQYNMLQIDLMANDPHVRSGRSQGEREALASTRLSSQQETINTIRLSVHDLDEILKVIKAKRTDLKDIQGRLKDQLKLCQEMIALGQRWGVKIDLNTTGESIIVGEKSTQDFVVDSYDTEEEEEDPVIKELFSKPEKKENLEISDKFKQAEVNEFLSTTLEDVVQKAEDFDLDELFEDFGV